MIFITMKPDSGSTGGDSPITGGIGAEKFLPVTELLADAVAGRAFPGAAYGVMHRGEVVALQSVGRFTYEAASPAVQPDTSFDLASVTKVMATTSMAMLLWQRGALDLDLLLGDVLPGFMVHGDATGGKRGVTLRLLLAHASGLPAYAPLYESCHGPAALLRATLALPLAASPGTVPAYSDPGFILLGKALEVIANERLADFFRRKVAVPLWLLAAGYNPADQKAVPPTEVDTTFRHRIIQGEVHDENCFVLGGVSGHAGLFAPVLDVLRFADALLQPLRPGPSDTLFSAEAVRLFTQRANLPPSSSRALGWDTPSGSPSSSGTHFSAASFGHLGYTGTSLWIDPVNELSVVLLTNRTFPTRLNKTIQTVRPRFHDAVFAVL